MKRSLLIILATAWATMAHAVVHFVPDDFTNLQEALDESNANDTIVCRDGTYYGPFFVWARNVTIASEFLIDQDPGHIWNCIIRPQRGDRDHRCLLTQEGDSAEHQLGLVGLTLALGRAVTVDEPYGGGIYLRDRTAMFVNCKFKSCLANRGGAIYCERSNLRLSECEFPGNDAVDRGRVLYANSSSVWFDDCDIGPSGNMSNHPTAHPAEIEISAVSLEMANTVIHDIGTISGFGVVFSSLNGLMSRSLSLSGCTIEDCNLRTLLDAASTGTIETFRMDSCAVRGNLIKFGFFRGFGVGSMRSASFTRNLFEENSFVSGYAGLALLTFTLDLPVTFVIEDNYFLNNDGFTASCVTLIGRTNPLTGRCQRNFFVSNRSLGFYFDGSMSMLIDSVGAGVFEYNALIHNIGDAVYTFDYYSPTSYALHNFWGDSTGPFEATRNPAGLGDTTNAATIYDEWLMSRDEIPDTTLYPPPNDVDERRWTVPSTWYIASVYPNPFNSEFQIELDGMTGPDFEIRLFDLLGREVGLLHSGRTLRGTLSFHTPANLAAGIYFLRAHDHIYSETKKVLYLK